MNLYEGLRKVEKTRIAFVGSGGKTTALFQLAHLMEAPVVVTCSTHLGAWQIAAADRHIILKRHGDVERFVGQIEGVTLFTGPLVQNNRYRGLDAALLTEVRDLSDRLDFSLLIEADGSRQLPLKAPAPFEPVIPDWVDTVIVFAGLSGLGKPLNNQNVHRAEIFSTLSGLAMEEMISEAGLSRVLEHREGGLKRIPASARRLLILNQADNADLINAGLRIANKVRRIYSTVLLTSLLEQQVWRVVEPEAGIILAGGESRRFGQPKMLLSWKGKTFIRKIAETALMAGLEPVVVVLGAVKDEIRQALDGLPVIFTENQDWRKGQSTSIVQGLRMLPEQVGSALFLLSDQPQVTVEVITSLITEHQKTLAPVIAPRIQGQRANPVLFDRQTFSDLMKLQGDTGGRAIFHQYPPEYLNWDDAKMLLDIDKPEDYERLKGME